MDILVDKRILFSKDEEDAYKCFMRNKLLKESAVQIHRRNNNFIIIKFLNRDSLKQDSILNITIILKCNLLTYRYFSVWLDRGDQVHICVHRHYFQPDLVQTLCSIRPVASAFLWKWWMSSTIF